MRSRSAVPWLPYAAPPVGLLPALRRMTSEALASRLERLSTERRRVARTAVPFPVFDPGRTRAQMDELEAEEALIRRLLADR